MLLGRECTSNLFFLGGGREGGRVYGGGFSQTVREGGKEGRKVEKECHIDTESGDASPGFPRSTVMDVLLVLPPRQGRQMGPRKKRESL